MNIQNIIEYSDNESKSPLEIEGETTNRFRINNLEFVRSSIY